MKGEDIEAYRKDMSDISHVETQKICISIIATYGLYLDNNSNKTTEDF